MNSDTGNTIPYTELPPARPGSKLATEWETYRREISRLLAEGHEGKTVVIKGDRIVGIYDSWDDARAAGLKQFLFDIHMVQTIRSEEPLLRTSWSYCATCPD